MRNTRTEKRWAEQSNRSETAAWMETASNLSAQSNVKRHPYYKQHAASDEQLSARAGLLFKCEALS